MQLHGCNTDHGLHNNLYHFLLIQLLLLWTKKKKSTHLDFATLDLREAISIELIFSKKKKEKKKKSKKWQKKMSVSANMTWGWMGFINNPILPQIQSYYEYNFQWYNNWKCIKFSPWIIQQVKKETPLLFVAPFVYFSMKFKWEVAATRHSILLIDILSN